MSPRPLRAASSRDPHRTPSIRFPKPTACQSCVLADRSHGFVPADGPPTAPILLVGEAAGYDEIATGRPFIGAAGSMLTKILRMNGWLREDFRIDNAVRCAPPGLALEGTPYATSALASCASYLDQTLAEPHAVVVPLGAVALRRVLGLAKTKGVRVQDFHGTVTRVLRPDGSPYLVVPTYHPSHLQRGATNLLGTVSFDLQRAHEVARSGHPDDPAELVCDPPVEWLRGWVDGYLAALRADPLGVWLAVDIETPDKGADEGELLVAGADAAGRITRVNLCCHPDQGVTVPDAPEYWAVLKDLFTEVARLGGQILMWFRGFDYPRLRAAGMPLDLRKVWDLMWAAKVFKSDLPMGLGFWAPFYSTWGAWKHLNESAPVKYAAIDGIQTLRVGYGLIQDVVDSGQWGVFERHLHDFHTEVLQPSQDVGVPIDRARLTEFGLKLDGHARRLLGEIQACVPDALRLLTPKEGLTRKPLPDAVHTKGRTTTRDGRPKKDAPDEVKAAFYQQAAVVEKLVLKEVMVCRRCGKAEVARTHRCADGDPENTRQILPQVATVTRWYWQEPFNADSPQQMLAYVKAQGHEPGRAKKTGQESTDRETLERLVKTGDPLYQAVLDYRAVAKVRGTYVKGTEKRLDVENRLHPSFTFKPSTMRLSCVAPNLFNVVTDRGGAESLAAGYRRCVKAASGSKILEFDFAGAEQVVMGWLMHEPQHIRLGKLGVHAFVASHILGRPADLTWSDADLKAYFKAIKGAKDTQVADIYDQSKRTVHGCVPGDHEVLTPQGWVRFDKLTAGTPVAQWERGQISFVDPGQIIRHVRDDYDEEPMVGLLGQGLQIVMTQDHRVPIRVGQTARVREARAGDLPRTGRIPVSGQYDDGCVDWSARLALLVAGQADGQLQDGRRWVFHLVKERKQMRLVSLLMQAGIPYSRHPCGCHAHGERIRFALAPDDWLTGEKHFNLPAWLRLSPDAREAFLDEVMRWDGTKNRTCQSYLSTIKANAIVVQTIAHLSGRQGLLRDNRRCGMSGNVLYSVSLNRRRWARLETLEQTSLKKPRVVYCVTVPSGYFLIRWQDTISVTGNSAYGLTVYGMVRQFPKTYPDLKTAERVQGAYFGACPWVPTYQAAVQKTAYDQHFLGGPPPYVYDAAGKRVSGHPYGYRHDFYDVLGYERLTDSQRLWREKRRMPTTEINGIWYGIKLGEDAKRAIAYYPQSIVRGVLTEAAIPLFYPDDHPEHDPVLYIGDAYFGKTPLRAPVYDSLMLEVPVRAVERVVERVFAAMGMGIRALPCPAAWGLGPFLTIGVDGKIGDSWAKDEMEAITPPSVAADRTYFAPDDRDDQTGRVVEDLDEVDLGTAVA